MNIRVTADLRQPRTQMLFDSNDWDTARFGFCQTRQQGWPSRVAQLKHDRKMVRIDQNHDRGLRLAPNLRRAFLRSASRSFCASAKMLSRSSSPANFSTAASQFPLG